MTKSTTFLVALFYPVIVVVAVLLLASVQLRSSGGSAFDTWRLNYNANRAFADINVEKLKKLRQESFTNLDNLNFTNLCLKSYDANGNLNKGINPQLLANVKAARDQGKKPDDFEGDMRCLMRGFIVLQYDKHYFEAKRDDFAADLTELQKAIGLNNDQYSDLIKNRQDFLAFKEMERSEVWYLKLIAVTPYDLMVLLLVMFMGALGGMARLLRDYGDPSRDSPHASDYLFIPLIGLVVAIGGYILAKTGLLLLSSTKDEASLSPFMISLVGIVSGLLAKDVIDAIARAGAGMVTNRQGAGTRPGGGVAIAANNQNADGEQTEDRRPPDAPTAAPPG